MSLYKQINLDSLKHNYHTLQESAPGHTMWLVLKADAYGHGLKPIAQSLQRLGHRHFAVASLKEAIELEAYCPSGRILIMSELFEQELPELLKHSGFEMSLSSLAIARKANALAQKFGQTLPVHVHIDTGMGRFGFMARDLPQVCAQLKDLDSLNYVGFSSHLASAEDPLSRGLRKQIDDFQKAYAYFLEQGFAPGDVHLQNSAGFLALPDTPGNGARIGLALYGHSLLSNDPLPLKPVLSVHSQVVLLKKLKVGDPVSYGQRFIATKDMRVAVISGGYSHGYPRSLSNCGSVLIGQQRCPILGSVCMDYCIVDVSELRSVELGQTVTLLGQQGSAYLGVRELSEQSGLIAHELLCALGRNACEGSFRSLALNSLQ